jgi:hypothetical protein
VPAQGMVEQMRRSSPRPEPIGEGEELVAWLVRCLQGKAPRATTHPGFIVERRRPTGCRR